MSTAIRRARAALKDARKHLSEVITSDQSAGKHLAGATYVMKLTVKGQMQ